MNFGGKSYEKDTVLDSVIIKHPLVAQLTNALNLNNFMFPYTLSNVILMDEGKWNNHYYSREAIERALNQTDWGNKNSRDVFYEHSESARDWIGEVTNLHMNDNKLMGDLIIHDFPTALKVQTGKPKIGISPKVAGMKNKDNIMTDFVFSNFSLVFNPAVKTTYLFNKDAKSGDFIIEDLSKKEDEIMAQVTDMEGMRKKMGMTSNEFYAIPREPPSESKLPIFDEAHCRNAMARFNQVEGVTPDEKATAKKKIVAAGKKFGINTENFEKEAMMMEETKDIKEVKEKELPKEDTQKASMTAEFESRISSLKEQLAEAEKEKEKLSSAKELSDMKGEITGLKKSIQVMSEILKNFETPDKLSVRTSEPVFDIQNEILKIKKKGVDQAMYECLKEKIGRRPIYG